MLFPINMFDRYVMVFQIYDGYYITKTRLGIYCGSVAPFTTVSISHILFVQLYSHTALSAVSFNAEYNLHCGSLRLTHTGQFSSVDRNQDGIYDTDINCTWIIQAKSYEFITLNLTKLDVQEAYPHQCDTLQVGIRTPFILILLHCTS